MATTMEPGFAGVPGAVPPPTPAELAGIGEVSLGDDGTTPGGEKSVPAVISTHLSAARLEEDDAAGTAPERLTPSEDVVAKAPAEKAVTGRYVRVTDVSDQVDLPGGGRVTMRVQTTVTVD